MNRKIERQALPLLLAVLLVSVGVMPIASAIENEGAEIDFDQYSPPRLSIDPPIETIAIFEALSPQVGAANHWANDLKLWSITIYDHTTGQYSSLSTNCIPPQAGDRVACVLDSLEYRG